MGLEELVGPMIDEAEREFDRIWELNREHASAAAPEIESTPEDLPREIDYSTLVYKKRKTSVVDREDEVQIALRSKKQLVPNHNTTLDLQSPMETDGKEKPEKLHPPTKKSRTNPKPIYIQSINIDTSLQVSNWNVSSRRRGGPARGAVETVKYVVTLIDNCVAASHRAEFMKPHLHKLREQIHKMPFLPFLTPELVNKSKVLDNGGLSRIFASLDPGDNIFPFDIRADAQALWASWTSGDIVANLLRGIDVVKLIKQGGSSKVTYSLTPNLERKYNPNVFGDNNIMNGQWWPLRICALRDGAHGATEAGIHGNLKDTLPKGAYSIVVADGGYKDEDNGDEIKYCSTPADPLAKKPTDGTRMLLASMTTHTPVRVLRAVKKNSKYAPRSGIRYDGLYRIIEKEVLDERTSFMRFSLKRLPNQDPIRYQGVEARPTAQEEAEMARVRSLLV